MRLTCIGRFIVVTILVAGSVLNSSNSLANGTTPGEEFDMKQARQQAALSANDALSGTTTVMT